MPWKRGRGHATRALALLLPKARAEGLPYVEVTTLADNDVSQRVIRANGGVLIESFTQTVHHGSAETLRFRIALAHGAV